MNILSYISPIRLYRVVTKHNSILEVFEVAGRIQLFLDGFPQSNKAYLRDWRTILTRAKVSDLSPQSKVLLLGLGGGNVITLLRSLLNDASYTAIELEPEVVRVAQKYFGIGEFPKLQIVVRDAASFIHDNRTDFDLIVVDLYSGDDIPTFVSSNKFLKGLSSSLRVQGKVIINYASHNFKSQDFAKFEKALSKHVTLVTQLKTWGHTYYLASNS